MKLKKKLRTQTYYVCVLKLLKERNYTLCDCFESGIINQGYKITCISSQCQGTKQVKRGKCYLCITLKLAIC
jgi:hypothetical protein